MDQPPLILTEGQDPIETLLSIAAFTEGSRGLCEIWTEVEPIMSVPTRTMLGMAALGAQPEKDPVPIFEHNTRAVRVCLLADWLEEHGLSPAGARWHRKLLGLQWTPPPDPKSVRWELIVKAPTLPAMPPEPIPLDQPLTQEQIKAMLGAEVQHRYRMAAGGLTDPDPAPTRGLARTIGKGR